MKKNLVKVLIIISGILISINLYFIGNWVYDYFNTKQVINSLKTIPKKEILKDDYLNYLVEMPLDKHDPYYNYVLEPFLEVDFTNLLKDNSDVVLWLKIPNTTINYAVVQKDNSYYLNHSFNKKESDAGWLFVDERNDIENLGYNTIIYGHRRLDNTMFGDLIKFLNAEWFDNKDNHIIKMSSLTENTIWQIFSVYVIDKESYYIKTKFNENSYQEFLEVIKKRSYYDFNTSLTTNNKVLTLSTCYNNYGKRLVVHAKLIKQEKK